MSKPGYIIGTVCALALSTGRSSAQGPTDTPAEQVTAFLQNEHLAPLVTLASAQRIATEMFRAASVRLEWRPGAPSSANRSAAPGCPPAKSRPVVVVVRFQLSTDIPPQNEGVMAYTHPYARSDAAITVIYDRLSRAAPQQSGHTSAILAHLMVHEITHVLQRVSRHSEEGLMKVHWTTHDYADMDRHPLAFAPEDIELIQLGLASWRQESCRTGRHVDLIAKDRTR